MIKDYANAAIYRMVSICGGTVRIPFCGVNVSSGCNCPNACIFKSLIINNTKTADVAAMDILSLDTTVE
jgi:hypothetical protein